VRGRRTNKPTNFMEELTVTHIVKKFLAFYQNLSFITLFTIGRHWSISWARCIQYKISCPISLRSILILSSYLCIGLQSSLYPSGFPIKILYAFLMSPIPDARNSYKYLRYYNYHLLSFIVVNIWEQRLTQALIQTWTVVPSFKIGLCDRSESCQHRGDSQRI